MHAPVSAAVSAVQSDSEVQAPAILTADVAPQAQAQALVDVASNAGGSFEGERDFASTAVHTLRNVRTASVHFGAALQHWREGPPSSRGAARLDDATNAMLVELCDHLASLQEAVLGCLNEQALGGDDSVRDIAWAAVARDRLHDTAHRTASGLEDATNSRNGV